MKRFYELISFYLQQNSLNWKKKLPLLNKFLSHIYMYKFKVNTLFLVKVSKFAILRPYLSKIDILLKYVNILYITL